MSYIFNAPPPPFPGAYKVSEVRETQRWIYDLTEITV